MRHPAFLALPALLACTGVHDTSNPCMVAVVTDIDETLTTSDGEWLAQLGDGTYDPEMRPQADALFNDYADLGYSTFYVTARGTDIVLDDQRSATQATQDWLEGRGFPLRPGALFLAPGIGAAGQGAVTYKAGVLSDLQGEGWTFAFAYGNAESDILGFQQAGIPDADIFLVGSLAGTMGVSGIADDDAYATHRASHVPDVSPACTTAP